jgi:predicted Zn-dependent protease
VLPKAELTIEPHYPQKLTTVELTMEADRARERAEKTRSPYLRALHTLTAEWFRTGGAADASKPALWMAAGRTAAEKSAALVELIGLQAQQGRLDEARAMCDRIVDTLPGAAVIWREYVALSGGDPKVVARARTACPTDSDIWLASLVLRVKDKPDAAALNSEIEAAARKRLYPAGAFVRAGDLLRRQKLVKPASAAARYAIANGRGLVPAYLLGFLCGVDAGELDWAFSCAVNGADAATDPWPFLKAAAEIARRRGDTGESTVAVLRRLVAQYPQEPVWRSRLAGLLIRREQPEEAVDILRPVLSNTNGGAAFDIVVAEALRGVGQTDQAVVLLRRGLLAHPENEALANNLAFALSLSSNGQGEALQMVEQRLARQTNSLAAMDTAAFVNLRAGKSSQALPFLKNVVKLLASTDARWLAANPGVVSVADVGMVSSMKTLEDDPAVKKEIELIRAAIVARLSSTRAGR